MWASPTSILKIYTVSSASTLHLKNPTVLLQKSKIQQKFQTTRNTKITAIYETLYTNIYKTNKINVHCLSTWLCVGKRSICPFVKWSTQWTLSFQIYKCRLQNFMQSLTFSATVKIPKSQFPSWPPNPNILWKKSHAVEAIDQKDKSTQALHGI